MKTVFLYIKDFWDKNVGITQYKDPNALNQSSNLNVVYECIDKHKPKKNEKLIK